MTIIRQEAARFPSRATMVERPVFGPFAVRTDLTLCLDGLATITRTPTTPFTFSLEDALCGSRDETGDTQARRSGCALARILCCFASARPELPDRPALRGPRDEQPPHDHGRRLERAAPLPALPALRWSRRGGAPRVNRRGTTGRVIGAPAGRPGGPATLARPSGRGRAFYPVTLLWKRLFLERPAPVRRLARYSPAVDMNLNDVLAFRNVGNDLAADRTALRFNWGVGLSACGHVPWGTKTSSSALGSILFVEPVVLGGVSGSAGPASVAHFSPLPATLSPLRCRPGTVHPSSRSAATKVRFTTSDSSQARRRSGAPQLTLDLIAYDEVATIKPEEVRSRTRGDRALVRDPCASRPPRRRRRELARTDLRSRARVAKQGSGRAADPRSDRAPDRPGPREARPDVADYDAWHLETDRSRPDARDRDQEVVPGVWHGLEGRRRVSWGVPRLPAATTVRPLAYPPTRCEVLLAASVSACPSGRRHDGAVWPSPVCRAHPGCAHRAALEAPASRDRAVPAQSTRGAGGWLAGQAVSSQKPGSQEARRLLRSRGP